MLIRTLPALAVLALTTTATMGLADGLSARISTDKLAIGETFQLTLSADPAKLTAPPDVSALNSDFDILGTSSSSRTRIINGARSDTIEWTITLAPRAKGHLTIPVLSAGQATSEALSVDVVDAADLPADQQAQGVTAISVKLEPGTYYVQQEIPLTVRITPSEGFRGGTISVPYSPDYILAQHGEDRASQMTRNGQPVTVIERDYLLRPQKSGTLTIAPFKLTATEVNRSAKSPFAQSPFDSFFGGSPFGGPKSPLGRMLNPGREIVVRSAPLTLEVKAKPAASADWFLPAKAVTLTATWDPANPGFRVGEAVTRHVRIQALGATEVQLPDLALPQVTGARIYLEKTDAGSVDTPEGTAAVRDFTYSVVPTTGDSLTLPEVTIDWFDTTTETARVATLAAETIEVEGAVTTAPPQQETPVDILASPAAVSSHSDTTASGWIGALAIAIIAALVAASYSWRHRGNSHGASRNLAAPAKPPGASRRKTAIRQVETACRECDPKTAYRAALRWLHAAAVDMGLEDGAIWQRCPDLRASWHDLEVRVFSAQAEGNWDAHQFLQDIRAADRKVGKSTRRPPRAILPPLYAPDGHMRGKQTPV